MSEEDAFLHGIRLNPDDHVLRLVYADWLDERGDPRGEYLRLECRLADLRAGISGEWRRADRLSDLRVEQLRLDSGRQVSLRALRQFCIYEGLLEGLPTREMNAQIIADLIAEERRARPYSGPPHVLPAEQKPIEYRRGARYPFGEPAELPGVGCVGRFHCMDAARDPARDFSDLTVIWFQHHFAPPVGDEVWPLLRALDWERLAEDGDY